MGCDVVGFWGRKVAETFCYYLSGCTNSLLLGDLMTRLKESKPEIYAPYSNLLHRPQSDGNCVNHVSAMDCSQDEKDVESIKADIMELIMAMLEIEPPTLPQRHLWKP